jgi:hypothetical protein
MQEKPSRKAGGVAASVKKIPGGCALFAINTVDLPIVDRPFFAEHTVGLSGVEHGHRSPQGLDSVRKFPASGLSTA